MRKESLFTPLHNRSFLLSCLLWASLCQAADPLPSLGEAAANMLSPTQATEIGNRVVAQFQQQGQIVEDVLLNDYLQTLGQRLAGAAKTTLTTPRFILVHDAQINAFATPGPLVVIYSGLFNKLESEAELAVLLAHELAHLTLYHHGRMALESRPSQWVGLSLLLAGMLSAQQDLELSSALIYSAFGKTTKDRLQLQQRYEYEADQIGMHLLTRTGYPAQAMLQLIDRLIEPDEQSWPAYLRSHPLNSERKRQIAARAEQIAPLAYMPVDDYFLLMKRRLLAQATDRPKQLRNQWLRQPASAARDYGLALLYHRLHMPELAQPLIASHHALSATAIWLLLAAENAALREDWEQSNALYQQLLRLSPGNTAALESYARVLLQRQQHDKTHYLLHSQQALWQDKPQHAILYRLLAAAAHAQGQHSQSAAYMAEYYIQRQQIKRALEQLHDALQQSRDKRQTQRLRARRQQLQNQPP